MANAAGEHARIAAFLTAAVLERYEEHLAPLVHAAGDPGPAEQLACDFLELRHACAALPELRVPWLAFLISHHELLGMLACGDAQAALQRKSQAHRDRIHELSAQCRELFVRRH